MRDRKTFLRRWLTLLCFTLLASGITSGIFAQEYSFRTWSLREGLPKPGIYALMEDRQGYLWIASEGGGLVRFNGQEFRAYTQRDGLGNNTVRCLMEDSKGGIWAGTDGGGVSRLFKGTLSNYKEGLLSPRVRAMAEDSTGTIWIGTMGGGLHSFRNGEIHHYGVSEGLPSNKVRSLLTDSKGQLWIGTDGGLVRKTEDGFKVYGIKDGIYPSHILCLFEDSKGRVWFGTGRGAGYFKEGNFYVFSVSDGLPHPRVRGISEDANGNIWLGTMDGASRYNGDTFENFKEENGLSYNRVRTVVRDAQGNMWFGTYFGGLCQFRDKRFAYYSIGNDPGNTIIQALEYDPSDNRLLMGTWEGLFTINQENGGTSHYDTLNGLLHQVVNCAAHDGQGGVWIGYDKEGLSKLENGRFSHYAQTEAAAAESGIPFEHIERMHHAGKGRLWLVWRDGQIGMLDNGTYVNYSRRLNIESSKVKTVVTDKRGSVWIGTAGEGLLQISPSGALQTYDHAQDGLPDNTVTALGLTREGGLWIGGPDGALSYLRTGRIRTFPELSKQLNSGITNLEMDASNQLWITMDQGIAQVTLSEGGKMENLRRYGEATGFRGISCLPGAVTVDGEGVLWLGTLDGLTAFDPTEAYDNANAPRIHLTGVSLMDPSESPLNYSDSTNHFGAPVSMDLPFRLNDFSFEFEGLSLKYPEQVKYSWKLAGHQEQWSPSSSQQTASFSRLPPGHYIFQVKATNETGLWSEPTSLALHISRPWWSSWWFYLFGALVLGGIIAGFIRLRTASLLRQKENLEGMVQDRTAQLAQQTQAAELARERAEYSEQVKEQFLANMSHEIRTPMNAIVGMTKLMIDKSPKPDQVEYLDAIKQSSDNLLVIINDILDISKIEAGKMTFEQIDFSLPQTLKTVYQTLRHKAEEKGIEFKLYTDERVPEWVAGDPTRLSQILINLAGNAIKFTEKGQVSIGCKTLVADERKIKLRFDVKDTGIGIPIDKQDTLFESFTQASSDTTRQYGGTGLGLSISKQLVELQGGEIDLESEEGVGSNFFFTIFYNHGEAPAEAKAQETTTHQIAEDIRILLVEDNPFNQMVAVDSLQSRLKDAKITVAENGRIGVEQAQTGKFDIILMDLQMPEMDGYEATETIRAAKNPVVRNIPIMAMTAGATQAEMDHCKAVGMNDFITKPFDIEVLLQKISALTQTKATT